MSKVTKEDHVEFLKRNICRDISESGGGLKRWEEREDCRVGKVRGKERASRGCGGRAGCGRCPVGSKPQNWDVILLRVCWEGGREGGWPGKAGCAGQPGRPPRPGVGGEVLVSGSSSEPLSSRLRSRSPEVLRSSSLRSEGELGPSMSSSESESESCGSVDRRSFPSSP